MRIKYLLFFSVLVLLAFGLSSTAFASTRIDLIKNDTLEIERLPSRGYRILRIFAYNDNNELVVTGRVKRLHSTYFGTGHVDIAIISPGGEILNQVSTSYTPRYLRRKPSRGSRFEVRFPDVPQVGSTVRIVHHRNDELKNIAFQCENNMAASDGS